MARLLKERKKLKLKKKIYYLSYYDINNGDRIHALSCVNKMNYIIDILVKMGYVVEIISASYTQKKEAVKGEYKEIKKNVYLKTFYSSGYGHGIKRIFQRLIIKKQLKAYIKKLDSLSPIIVYHSLGYIDLYKQISLKMDKFILEVEEIYADVIDNKKIREKEIEFFKNADSFIFPTELLDKEINKKNKPYVIIHGTYKVEEQKSTKFRDKDGKIHIVYAGTFDPRKGGAAAAAAAAEFLRENYHIHILGFGSQEETDNIKKIILEVSKKTKCIITYDGLKSEDEYISFIQSCDIGLSTQNPNADFNGTSFPSKILSYMSNGLRVVSIDIPAIKSSDIGDYMYYYKKQTPEEIANAIQKVDINDNYDSRKIIYNLDKKFVEELLEIL